MDNYSAGLTCSRRLSGAILTLADLGGKGVVVVMIIVKVMVIVIIGVAAVVVVNVVVV